MIELVAGAVITALSFASGVLAGRRQRRAKVEAVCPCGHAINFHENLTGCCYGTHRVKIFSKDGADLGYHPVRCSCQIYAGPELVSSITMRPIVQLPRADS